MDVRGLVAGDGARERVCRASRAKHRLQRRPNTDRVWSPKNGADWEKAIGARSDEFLDRRGDSRFIREIWPNARLRASCDWRDGEVFSPVRGHPARGVRRRLRTRARRRQVESPPQHSPGAGSPTPRVVRRSLRCRVRTPPAQTRQTFRPPPSASRDKPRRWKPSPSARGARDPPREPSPASPWDPGRRYARVHDAHALERAPSAARPRLPTRARPRSPSPTAFCAFTGAPFAIERQLTFPPRAGPLRVHVQAPQLRGRDQVHQGLHRAVQRGASNGATRHPDRANQPSPN